MTLKAKVLVDYATAQLGKPYWYGTYGKIASEDLYKAKKKQYPNYYTANDFPKQYGKRVHDCVGLIKGCMWSNGDPDGKPIYELDGFPDVSANGLYSYCKQNGTIDTIPDVPGICVFKSGHVGVYVGNGYVVEAKGHAYGVVRTKLNATPWTHWGAVPGIDYSGAIPYQPTPAKPKTIKRGDTGSLVTKLQDLLLMLGYDLPLYGADGDFGEETEEAVRQFQKDTSLPITGIVDQDTADVILAKSTEGDENDSDTGETVEVFEKGSWTIRSGAGTQNPAIAYAKHGDVFGYIATATNGWISIYTPKGNVGWISPKCARVK